MEFFEQGPEKSLRESHVESTDLHHGTAGQQFPRKLVIQGKQSQMLLVEYIEMHKIGGSRDNEMEKTSSVIKLTYRFKHCFY